MATTVCPMLSDVPASAASASGTSTVNVDGEAIAITVFSTIRWWGLIELPLFMLFIRLRKNGTPALLGVR
jgi:hypothetical protein